MGEPKYFNEVFFNMLKAVGDDYYKLSRFIDNKAKDEEEKKNEEDANLIKIKLSDKCNNYEDYYLYNYRYDFKIKMLVKREWFEGKKEKSSEQKHLFLLLKNDIGICINLNNILIVSQEDFTSFEYIRDGWDFTKRSINLVKNKILYTQKIIEYKKQNERTKKLEDYKIYIQKARNNTSIDMNETIPKKYLDNLSTHIPDIIFHRDPYGKFAIALYIYIGGHRRWNYMRCVITGLTEKPFTSDVFRYAYTTDKESKKGTVNYDQYIKMIPNKTKIECFKINNGGGSVNPKAKVMHTIRLNISRPDTFIIGKYDHPLAPYIVLPAKSDWITRSTITFPTGNGKKLVVYKKGNRLIAPTSNNTFDVFLIKHIVKKRAHARTGGALTMVVDGESNENEKCVALTLSKSITLTKLLGQKDFTYNDRSEKINAEFISENKVLLINQNKIPTYNVTSDTTEIKLYKTSENYYILGVGVKDAPHD